MYRLRENNLITCAGKIEHVYVTFTSERQHSKLLVQQCVTVYPCQNSN